MIKILSNQTSVAQLPRHLTKKPLALIISILIINNGGAWAAGTASDTLPTGGTIVSGSAQMTQTGRTLTVLQNSPKLITQWSTFDIGSQSKVEFKQPSVSSTALNRVSGASASVIEGTLQANGQVFLLNPNGVLFGQGARVDVGGLLASTLDMTNSDFNAGQYRFSSRAEGNGKIQQAGTIHAPGGVVALIAPEITQSGKIEADGGSVVLAAAKAVEIDFVGDGLVKLKLDPAEVNTLLDHSGEIQAQTGTVIMSTSTANALHEAVVNTSGVIRAQRLVNRGGRIYLDSGAHGQTTVNGHVDVSSASGQGGDVVVTGQRINIQDQAHLNASGAQGGGQILIGGGWQGQDSTILQATQTVIAEGALLKANATDTGHGGTIAAWSDIHNPLSVTQAHGRFEAQGGPHGGNGGRIETSGYRLDVSGAQVNTGAQGISGMWLLDPHNYTINANEASAIQNALNNADVTVSTQAVNPNLGSSTDPNNEGNITVNAPISWSQNKLMLSAANNIDIHADLEATGSASLGFEYGSAGTYTVSNGTKIQIPSGDSFTWKKGSDSTKNLFFNNGLLAFGNSEESSFTGTGHLKQPWYKNPDNVFSKLTIGSNPLDFAIEVNADETGAWKINEQTIKDTQSGINSSGLSLDISGYKEGKGSVTTSIILDDFNIKLKNKYTLNPNENFIRIESTLTNLNSSNINNLRFWVGTRDDWIGNSDRPYKEKGNLVNGGFEAITTQNTAAQALKITEANSGGGAVLFFSTSDGTDTSISGCCSFRNAAAQDPRTSVMSSGATDGSYALFLRMANLAPNASGSMTWFYAAGSAANISNIVNQVQETASVPSSIPITISTLPLSVVYGTTPSYTLSKISGNFSGDLDSILSGMPSCLLCNNVGTYAVDIGSLVASNGYTLTWQPGTLTVTPAPLTVTAVNQRKIYGAPDPVLTYSVNTSQLKYADTASVVSGIALSAPTGAQATAGSHTITATGGLADNYAISIQNGTLTVDKAALTVSADSQRKVYGDTDPNLTYTVNPDQLKYQDTAAVVSGIVLSAPTGAQATAGSHTITATGGLADNYAISTQNGILTVDKAALTVSADSQSKVYGDTDPTLTYTHSPLMYNDTHAVFSGHLSRNPGETVVDGPYAIQAGSLNAGSNYDIRYTGATLTIQKRPITLSAIPVNKIYGEDDPALQVNIVAGNLGGVSVNDTLEGVTGTLNRQIGNNTGSYHILLGNGDKAPNYDIHFVSENKAFVIERRPVLVLADNQNKIYGDSDPVFTYNAEAPAPGRGLLRGETLNGNLVRTEGETVNGGPYPITQGSVNNAQNSNYDIIYTGATLAIAKRPINLAADRRSKTSGDGDPNLSVGVAPNTPLPSLQNGQTITDTLAEVTGLLSRLPGENAGNYNVVLGRGDKSDNYAISFIAENRAITILPRPVFTTVDANPNAMPNTKNTQMAVVVDVVESKITAEDNSSSQTTKTTDTESSAQNESKNDTKTNNPTTNTQQAPTIAQSNTNTGISGAPVPASTLSQLNPTSLPPAPLARPPINMAGNSTGSGTPSTSQTPSAAQQTMKMVAEATQTLASATQPLAAINSMVSSSVATAIDNGLSPARAEAVSGTVQKALTQQLSQGVPIAVAVDQAAAIFKAEASFPKPASPQTASALNIASAAGNPTALSASLSKLSGAQSKAGVHTFSQGLGAALSRGGDVKTAVETAQKATQLQEKMAQADTKPAQVLTGANADSEIFNNMPAKAQGVLGNLLAQGLSFEQAMKMATEIQNTIASGQKADASNPNAGVASGNLNALGAVANNESTSKVLAQNMGGGLSLPQAMLRTERANAEIQRLTKAEQGNVQVGFANGSVLPGKSKNSDMAIAAAIGRGESAAQAMQLLEKINKALPPEKPSARSALATGQISNLLSSPSNSRTFQKILSHALGNGMPIEKALEMARKAENETAVHFQLPKAVLEQLGRKGSNTVSISAGQGENLPTWIRFDANSRSFVAHDIPPGGLPLRIMIGTGKQQTTLEITEHELQK